MSRRYESGTNLQQKILKGVNLLADNVASTLGPRGRNVILHHPGQSPVITKDGVTVAKFVELEDPFENVGAQIIKQGSPNKCRSRRWHNNFCCFSKSNTKRSTKVFNGGVCSD